MQTRPRASHRPLPIRFPPGSAPPNPQPWATSGPPTVSDRSFLSMLGNYRSSGGLARLAEVVALVERDGGHDAGQVERWCAARRVICFEWSALRWLPRFQFAGAGVLPDPTVASVLAELNTVFDACEVAQWFATRNSSLTDRAPVDVIREQPAAVLEAARGDRFIADG
jgi:hypothetical protein